MRPIDVMGGRHLFFRCSNTRCFNKMSFELPAIEKTIVYLDTSTVSHMARAKVRGDADAPYLKLYEALRRASARNLIACPGSTIVETEAEFSAKYADVIIDMSRHLSDPGLHHQLEVKEAQLFRALRGWLEDAPAQLELAPPSRDAFQDDIHAWHGTFNIFMNARMPEEWVHDVKSARQAILAEVEKLYRAYETDDFNFEQIVAVEERGYAEAVRITGLNGSSNTLPKISMQIERALRCGVGEACQKAIDFLASGHARAIPFAYISGRLSAALAMRCRGKAPRRPKPGDQYDMDHMATFVPYVDVFIADNEMASLANENHLRLGEPFETKIQSLGTNDVPHFIDWLESLADGNEVAALSERIGQSIWQGGFNQDFLRSMQATTPQAFRDTAE